MAPVSVRKLDWSFVTVPKGWRCFLAAQAPVLRRTVCFSQHLFHSQMCPSNPDTLELAELRVQFGLFSPECRVLSALRGKPFSLLSEKTFKKHHLKIPNTPTPNSSKNPFKESAGAKLLCRAAAPFSQSRSSRSRAPKCSVRRTATESNVLRKMNSLKAHQKMERISMEI